MVTKVLLRAARAATVAAVMVAASDLPESAAANQVALHLASVRCEKEKLRRKLTEALQCGRMHQAMRLWIPQHGSCAAWSGPEPPADSRAPAAARTAGRPTTTEWALA
jgi:hypothetical protein